MNTRSLYKVAIVGSLLIFLLAAVTAVAGNADIALSVVSVGLALSVLSAHLRHRMVTRQAKAHGLAQTKAHSEEFSKVVTMLRVDRTESVSALKELSDRIAAMSTTGELNLHASELKLQSSVASSESIILADLLTLRHRIDTALTSRELG